MRTKWAYAPAERSPTYKRDTGPCALPSFTSHRYIHVLPFSDVERRLRTPFRLLQLQRLIRQNIHPARMRKPSPEWEKSGTRFVRTKQKQKTVLRKSTPKRPRHKHRKGGGFRIRTPIENSYFSVILKKNHSIVLKFFNKVYYTETSFRIVLSNAMIYHCFRICNKNKTLKSLSE